MISSLSNILKYRKIRKYGCQQAVPFTGADDADAEFLLHLTNFLTADNAADG